jgi:TolB-like protein/DNA-binding winged helix-turn-helix (wHTH) protein/tetratricopeptide (TPR) repeat protein
MAVPISTGNVVRFGAFELDLRVGELRKHGLKLRLQGQPLQVLEILTEHAGNVVSREALRERLWPADTFVDFDHSLNNAVARIREALGDSAEEPRFIQTIPRRGYRFLASVDHAALASVQTPAPQEAAEPQIPVVAALTRADDRWRLGVPEIAVIAVVAALAVLTLVGAARWWKASGSASPQVHAIAVLPFTNLASDPSQEYFADGITEELITELGKVSALRVISHTSVNRFKGTKDSLQQIAKELQVDALVEGVVLREANRVRVTANLVQAFPEKHLWAETYDRDVRNLLDLQSEIARTVADQIQIAVTPEERQRLSVSQPVDPEAHELLLKGYFYIDKWTEPGFQKATEYFNSSVQKDPRNARAYAGLALAYGGIGISDAAAYPKQKAAALEALKLDDTLADAHSALAWAELTYDWDTTRADSEFRRAIELNPNDSRAHAYYGIALAMLGRIDDSLREVKRTRELDPLSLAETALAWRTYYNGRDYAKAIQALQNAADMDPSFVSAYLRMIPVYEQMGELDKAIEMLERAGTFDKEHGKEFTRQAALLRKAYSSRGARGYWLQSIEFLNVKKYSGDAISLAMDYNRLGRRDEAFRSLEAAITDRVPYLIWDLPADPAFDDLRSDPRYAALLRRLVPRSQ